nr:MAG TPA: hypothetical protein [Bacteriophage sp.]
MAVWIVYQEKKIIFFITLFVFVGSGGAKVPPLLYYTIH